MSNTKLHTTGITMPMDGISNLASSAIDKVDEGAKKAKSTVSDGADTVTDTASQAKDKASQAKDAATTKATDTWENATESAYDAVVGRGSDMAQSVGNAEENVREMKEDIAEQGLDMAKGIVDRGVELKEDIADQGSEIKEGLAEQAPEIAKTAGEMALDVATGPVPVGPAMSVWEAMNSSDEFEPGPGEFNVEDNPAGRDLVEAFHHLDKRDNELWLGVGPAERKRVLNNRVFGDTNRSDRIELAANARDVRQHLIDETGNVDLANDIVERLQDHVLYLTTNRIQDKARQPVSDAKDNLEQLNLNSDTRRAFLAGVATGSDSEAEIAQKLEHFGLPASDAEEMAEVLDEIRTNEFARNAFMDGNEGPKPGSFSTGAYESLESDFEDILDDVHEGLERLHTSLGNEHTKGNNELLVNEYAAPVRDEVLAEMGAVMKPESEVNELGELFIEATEDAESSRFWRNMGTAAVMVGGSAVATMATKGAAIPAIAGAITTSGVSVADARMETSMAQGAVNADLADPELLKSAKNDEDIAYALAAADVLTAGVAGGVGTVEADVAGEAAGAANEFYGSTR